jgi:hypothetical protein
MRNDFDLIRNTMKLKLITRSHVGIIDVILSVKDLLCWDKGRSLRRKLMFSLIYYILTRTMSP